MNFLLGVLGVKIAEAAYTSSTLAAEIETQIDTAWGYVQAVLGTIWPFAVGLGVIIGLIALFRRISRMK